MRGSGKREGLEKYVGEDNFPLADYVPVEGVGV